MLSFLDFTGSAAAAPISHAIVAWTIMCVAFVIVNRHGGNVDAGRRASLFALMAIPMWILIAMSGSLVGHFYVTKIVVGGVAQAVQYGRRLDPMAIDAFGTPQALAAFAGALREMNVDERAQTLLGGLLMLAGGSAAAIHVWRATTADLPAIRWRHGGVGAVVTIAVWVAGIHIGTSELSAAHRDAYQSVAKFQTLRCPILSVPCPVNRRHLGGT
ncbi:MAG: hypothetical protein IBJ15_02195 [Alphaproteobacteria bacterium]|nr:hypothetical protein [Alphaproteobacteria bacterium]